MVTVDSENAADEFGNLGWQNPEMKPFETEKTISRLIRANGRFENLARSRRPLNLDLREKVGI